MGLLLKKYLKIFSNEHVIVSIIIGLFAMSIVLSIHHTQGLQANRMSGTDLLMGTQEGVAVIDVLGPIAFMSSPQTFIPMGAEAILSQIEEVEIRQRCHKGVLRASDFRWLCLERVQFF